MNSKNNVKVFNSDVKNQGGYQYTRDEKYSAKMANMRLTQATLEGIEFFAKRKQIFKLLDVGCGDGTYTNEIARAFPNITVFGFDPAANAIERAKLMYPTIKFRVGDILNSSDLDEVYDIVVVRGVIHHLSAPSRAIENLSHIAKAVIIIEPNGNNPILKLIEKTSQYHIDHEEQSFRPRLISKWLNSSKFTIESRFYVGFIPFFFPERLARLIYFFQPVLERIPIVANLFSACSVFYCTGSRIK